MPGIRTAAVAAPNERRALPPMCPGLLRARDEALVGDDDNRWILDLRFSGSVVR